MKWITLEKLAADTGFSREAIRALIKKGILLKGIHWNKTPHNRIICNVVTIENWMTSNSPINH